MNPDEVCPVEVPVFGEHLCGIPLVEVDQCLPEKTFCAVGKKFGRYYVHRFSAEKAFGFLGPLHKYRTFCISIVTKQYLDAVVLGTVCINTCLLAMKVTPFWLDAVFVSVFVTDILIRVTARGFVFHKYTYLRDVWNCLDFTVTVVGLIELVGILIGTYTAHLKSLRPFRLLKVFTIFPGLRTIMNTIINATTKMFEVIVLLFFSIVVFSLLGLQMFMSVLRQRCVTSMERLGVLDQLLYKKIIQNRTYWMLDGDDPHELGFVCGNFFGSYKCEEGFSCERVEEVEEDRVYPSFDNILVAILTTFNIFTLDSWEVAYNMLLESVGPLCFPLFLVTVMFGTAYLVNLMLAIIVHTYAHEDELQKARMLQAEGAFIMDLSLFEDMSYFTIDVTRVYLHPLTSPDQIHSDSWIRQLRFQHRLRKGETEAVGREFGMGIMISDVGTEEPKKAQMWGAVKKPAAGEMRPAFAEEVQVKAFRGGWNTLVSVCARIERNPVIDLTIHVLIILSTVLLALDSHNASQEMKGVISWGITAVSAAFAIEMAIKLIAQGFRFFSKKFAMLDFCAVVLGITSDILVLQRVPVGRNMRFLRLFRLIYVARTWDTLFYMINRLLSLKESLMYLMAVISVVVATLAIVALYLFSVQKPSQSRWNCDDFFHSLLLIVRVFCGELFEPLMGCFHEGHSPVLCVGFYILVFFIGNYVLLNVFLAFLLGNFSVDNIVQRNSPGEILFEEWMSRLKTYIRSRIYPPVTTVPQRARPMIDDEDHIPPCFHYDLNDRLFSAVPFQGFWLGLRRTARRIITHKVFRIFMVLLIILSSIVLCLEDEKTGSQPSVRRKLQQMNKAFAWLFTVEFVLMLLGKGVHDYFTSPWHLLDFFVQATSIMYLFLETTGEETALTRFLRSMRALRPMRIISQMKSIKIVVDALAASVPSIINVVVCCAFIWLVFGIVGMSLFAGRFYRCVDPQTDEVLSADLVPDRKTCHMLGYAWENAQVNFDNLALASLALFQVATFEGWIEVIEAAIDIQGIDLQPRREANPFSLIYFIIFIVIGAFLVFNLFVGVIIDNFYAKKRQMEEGFEMPAKTEGQKRFGNAIRKLLGKKPVRIFVRPRNSVKGLFYDVAVSRELERATMAIVMLNMIFLAMEQHSSSRRMRLMLAHVNGVFLLYYILEQAIKILGTGITFFGSKWNQFDLCVLIVSIIGAVLPAFVMNRSHSSLVRGLRILVVFKIFRCLLTTRGVGELLFIFSASVPAFANIALLLFLVTFVYAILGVSLFHHINSTENDRAVVNFHNFGNSMLLLFRLSTASNWNEVLDMLLTGSEICDPSGHCSGKWVAVVYLVTYIFLSNLIILNTYVAIMLDNYEISKDTTLSGMSASNVLEFATTWTLHDRSATRFIPLKQLSTLVEKLPSPIGVRKPNSLVVALMNIPIYERDQVHYVDVLQGVLRTRMNMYEELSKELKDYLQEQFVSMYPELKGLKAVSSTMKRKGEERAAGVLRQFFEMHCEKLRLERAVRMIQRTYRAYRFRRFANSSRYLRYFPVFMITQTDLQYW
ncbi:sodium channel protein type 4 subunit alpha A-like isoform X2 [Ornithodoros turicata]|uniref:sodium channel protein type 4 subunit alpha A-like isoform X2 n=1 Tax=Ornithodoros turicata TaxID=34597 RepID=UPI0031390D65